MNYRLQKCQLIQAIQNGKKTIGNEAFAVCHYIK